MNTGSTRGNVNSGIKMVLDSVYIVNPETVAPTIAKSRVPKAKTSTTKSGFELKEYLNKTVLKGTTNSSTTLMRRKPYKIFPMSIDWLDMGSTRNPLIVPCSISLAKTV